MWRHDRPVAAPHLLTAPAVQSSNNQRLASISTVAIDRRDGVVDPETRLPVLPSGRPHLAAASMMRSLLGKAWLTVSTSLKRGQIRSRRIF
jgi:hypothetical protein